ncbi:hypothetical protein TNCV_456181 [Trichonephila clavipes]|nr:hypothetical protein TNCV_456181 [Trichonephila clavipes]
MRVIGDGPRCIEPRLSDEDDTLSRYPLSKLPRPTYGITLNIDRFNVHRPSLRGGTRIRAPETPAMS